MELGTKEAVVASGWLVSLGSIIAWVKISIKGQEKRIKTIERRFTNDDGEPLIVTYPAHDIICAGKNALLVEKLQHVVDALEKNAKATKDIGVEVKTLTTTVAVLESKVGNNDK